MKRLLLSMFLMSMLAIQVSYAQNPATADPVIQLKIQKLKDKENQEVEKLKAKALKNSEKAHRDADLKAQKESVKIRKEGDKQAAKYHDESEKAIADIRRKTASKILAL